jgi:hydrogenase maturation protein HypF
MGRAQDRTAELMLTQLTTASQPQLAALRVRLSGRVQGVGYRPFVLQLAQRLEIAGSVRNLRGEVEIIAEGPCPKIESFVAGLVERAPPLAAPCIAAREPIEPAGRRGFAILQSSAAARANVFVPPDAFTCEECLRELGDPHDRRYDYPFINCTQCGPRYTLIDAMPYDRANTTMTDFPLCDACDAEYSLPGDRRFHAEPVACPVCGPRLSLEQSQRKTITATNEALRVTVQLLKAGRLLAVKGIGGYHLMCDACRPTAVAALRERKHRPHKPLAVLFPQLGADGLDAVRQHVDLDPSAGAALLSAARPIVLAPRRAGSTLASEIAPGLAEVGVLLPYSPLHHLLLNMFGAPLVATSGNVSGEPVLCDNDEARTRLQRVADAFLHHDRRIARPADDSVVRVVHSRARVLRLGRGLAPCEMTLPHPVPVPLLAVGGHLKTTIGLAWGRRAVVSPHIADMGTVRSEQVFAQVVADLQRLHGVRAKAVVCDAHPDYATTRWAKHCGLPVTSVQHHRAHASALAAEHDPTHPALVFTWDGVGLGDDGTLWGGEAFFGTPGNWRRVASIRPFRLPGGERAGRSPWRSAAAVCWEAGIDWSDNPAPPLVRDAWQHGVNTPTSSAVGRLFDAAAAIILGVHEATFEGQAPMLLEACAKSSAPDAEPLPIRVDVDDLLRIDWAPLFAAIVSNDASGADRAATVHATLALTIAAVARRLRELQPFRAVGLTGGVFQNRKLSELATRELECAGFDVWLSERIPCNDGGLALGQLVEASSPATR